MIGKLVGALIGRKVKEKMADEIIVNEGSLEDLYFQVDRLLAKI